MSALRASPRQLRYIAILATKAGIKSPIEEGVCSTAEAGRLIQELKREIKSKKR